MKVNVTIKDFKKEAAKRKIKKAFKEVKDTAVDIGKWCAAHPAEAISLGLGAFACAKKGLSWHQTRMEDYRRKVDFYDPRTGRHSIAKRPLNAKQQVEIDRRYRNNESYAEILYDMGLLKK